MSRRLSLITLVALLMLLLAAAPAHAQGRSWLQADAAIPGGFVSIFETANGDIAFYGQFEMSRTCADGSTAVVGVTFGDRITGTVVRRGLNSLSVDGQLLGEDSFGIIGQTVDGCAPFFAGGHVHPPIDVSLTWESSGPLERTDGSFSSWIPVDYRDAQLERSSFRTQHVTGSFSGSFPSLGSQTLTASGAGEAGRVYYAA